MLVDKKQIKKIAHLAKIRIDEENIDEYTKNLSNILNFFNHINEIDTENLSIYDIDTEQYLRDDVAIREDNSVNLQKLSANVDNNFYLVPKVIEQ